MSQPYDDEQLETSNEGVEEAPAVDPADTPETAEAVEDAIVEEVADAATFFLSKKSRGITGEVVYVDCGYHIMGM